MGVKIKAVSMVGVEGNGDIADKTIVKAGNKFYLVQEVGVNKNTTTKVWEAIRESSAAEFYRIYKNSCGGYKEFVLIYGI